MPHWQSPGRSLRYASIGRLRDDRWWWNMGVHDKAYRQLFSNPELVMEVLLVILPLLWGRPVRIRNLYRVGEGYVSRRADRSRLADLVWVAEVEVEAEDQYVVVVFEFTRTVDQDMLGRMMEYMALAWQSVRRELLSRGVETVPLVVGVVIYNGEKPWTAPDWTGKNWRGPSIGYLRIEVWHDPLEQWADSPLMSYVLRLQREQDPERAVELLRELAAHLRAHDLDHLEPSFAYFAGSVVLGGELTEEELSAMSKIEEVNTRLEQLKERCRQQGFEEGHERGFEEGVEQGRLQGLEEGRKQGLEEGERRGLEKGRHLGFDEGRRSALASVLETRFGPLPQWARERIQQASSEEVNEWIRRAVTAPCLEHVFEND